MPKRNVYLSDIPLDEARATLQAALEAANAAQPLPAERIPLTQALGRVTAAPVKAIRSSPHFHCAAMDGYALRAESTIFARETQPLRLRLGIDAFPVNTGDPLPAATNAVIMIEHVNPEPDGSLLIYAALPPWQHVRLMGEDIVATETVLQVNHVLRPVDLGALAGCGHAQVAVRRRPQARIIPTGDELLPHDQSPGRGQLTEYNSLMLAAQINQAGGAASISDIIGDDPDELTAALNAALDEESQLILLLSGSSAGAQDFSAAAISRLGDVLVHGIAVRPGHPVIIGMARGLPIIGVPGYPVSAALTGELLIAPLIRQWLGLAPPPASQVEAISTQKIASPLGDDDYARVALAEIDGKLQATPLGRGAGVITSLVRADGLAHIPRFHEGVDRGGQLQVALLRNREEIQQSLLIMGSHDPLLELLATHLRLSGGGRLVSVNVGSLGGLLALRRGEAHLAGTHLFDPESGSYNTSYVRRYLDEESVQLVTFAHREQGLMLAPGNPLDIQSISDLRRARFINRQRGAGTRVLLDYLLARQGIEPAEVAGYAHEEHSHLAVAAAVADGIGDCGMGLRGAAEALSLDFIGLDWERFDLAIPRRFMRLERMQALLATLRDAAFRDELGAQPGYRSDATGNFVNRRAFA
ncbi:MAG: molybdopterin biosynthesis protein [Chloroflexi bacterium]|nr:molybdopterin biosynthesis protein [Chloroflexota bacterium]MDE2652131.1 molybdopterin biosynthesis protein [Chloroflexota bacterium]MXV92780.1 molybdopterin biosynthesis protein [Chloroflexota bacterium]MXX83485.1 molybdopterin biosynthesis protein [Chloroflexota bacterium]MYA93899.1 molybdopterin biosynthesis protein [Chloroflexota bacterium]